MSSSKNILYHYTDFAALDGILSNSELRLNNILNMNDASEMILFMNGLCKAVSGMFRENGDRERAEWTEKIFSEEKEQEFVYSAYAACFSRYRDDAAQWERYANRGHGVCIAFREDLLREMAIEPLSLQTVFYQDEVGSHKLVDTLYQLISQNECPFNMTQEIRETLNHAWAASAAFKHPSFASENEVRLVVSPFEHGYFDVQPRYHITKERIKKVLSCEYERTMSNCRYKTGGSDCRTDRRTGIHTVGAYSAGLSDGSWLCRYGKAGYTFCVSAETEDIIRGKRTTGKN
ncbi:MAG: DUF2971 domain-containing protein [Clostridiales bacterium]|nr:DUF2971 domain-containing protein [Clostridiales bacterium]